MKTNTITRKRFGDARDEYLARLAAGDKVAPNPCTSARSLSTMPRRKAA